MRALVAEIPNRGSLQVLSTGLTKVALPTFADAYRAKVVRCDSSSSSSSPGSRVRWRPTLRPQLSESPSQSSRIQLANSSGIVGRGGGSDSGSRKIGGRQLQGGGGRRFVSASSSASPGRVNKTNLANSLTHPPRRIATLEGRGEGGGSSVGSPG